jgi:hypothetical protein
MKTCSLSSLSLALILCLLALPARAVDPTVNTILDIVLQEMAPELKPAKPFIVCLIDGGSVESCVKSFVGPSAAQAKGQTLEEAKKNLPFNPDSPDVKLVMDIVTAAKDGNWGAVIGKGGPYVARAVVCTVFVPPGAKSFGCPVIGYVIEHKASLVGQVLGRLKSQDVPGLVKILLAEFGPSTVCELIPDSALPAGSAALKDLGCGVVGKILGGLMSLGEAAASLAVEGVDEAWDLVAGGNDYMPYNDYYTKYWRPGYHYGTWVCLDTNGACKYPSGKGVWEMHTKSVFHACWKYYDDHDHWEDDAKKICTGMLNVFNKEVGKIAAAMQAAAQVYASEEAPKWAKLWAPADWGKPAAIDRKKQFQQQCTNAMKAKFPFPPSAKQPPVTAWAFVCKAAADKFAAEYAAATKQVAETVKKLETLGCKKAGLASAPKLSCGSYSGFEACKGAHEGKLPCTLDKNKADSALADELLKQLGTKRCKIVDEVKSVPCLKKDGVMGACPKHEKSIACSRPWKIDQCKELLAQLAANHPGSSVQCKGDQAGLAGFAMLEGEASAIRNTLNGASGPIGTKAGFGDAKAKPSAGTGGCKTGEPDTLKIHCPGGEFAAHPEIALPVCPLDPNLDGADAPCRIEVLMVPSPVPPATGTPPPPTMSTPPVLAPGAPGATPPPASPSPGRQSAPPTMGAPPVLAPLPADLSRTAPAANVPGCTAVPGAPGQYACVTREAYAACERLRATAAAGVRACQITENRIRR